MTDVPMTLNTPAGETMNIEMPDDIAIGELIPDFITSIGLPSSGTDGNPVTYKIISKHLGRELAAQETLAVAAVPAGTSLLIAPHAIAGGRSRGGLLG